MLHFIDPKYHSFIEANPQLCQNVIKFFRWYLLAYWGVAYILADYIYMFVDFFAYRIAKSYATNRFLYPLDLHGHGTVIEHFWWFVTDFLRVFYDTCEMLLECIGVVFLFEMGIIFNLFFLLGGYLITCLPIILFEAEFAFIPLVLILVIVVAICILFLFIVMFCEQDLAIDYKEVQINESSLKPILLFLAYIYYSLRTGPVTTPQNIEYATLDVLYDKIDLKLITNIQQLGIELYTEYGDLLYQLTILLLTSMLGSIYLINNRK